MWSIRSVSLKLCYNSRNSFGIMNHCFTYAPKGCSVIAIGKQVVPKNGSQLESETHENEGDESIFTSLRQIIIRVLKKYIYINLPQVSTLQAQEGLKRIPIWVNLFPLYTSFSRHTQKERKCSLKVKRSAKRVRQEQC